MEDREDKLREAAKKSLTSYKGIKRDQEIELLVDFAKSESVNKYHSNAAWINISDGLPILKRRYEGMLPVVENSVEVIVSDGLTSWVDYFTFDEGFHESVIKWQPIPKP